VPPNVTRIRQIMAKARQGREAALVYIGQSATGLIGAVDKDLSWQIQGYQDEYSVSVWVDADAFTTEPAATRTISVNGNNRRILAVYTDTLGAFVRLDLGALYASG
jgi:hypothetical protein